MTKLRRAFDGYLTPNLRRGTLSTTVQDYRYPMWELVKQDPTFTNPKLFVRVRRFMKIRHWWCNRCFTRHCEIREHVIAGILHWLKEEHRQKQVDEGKRLE